MATVTVIDAKAAVERALEYFRGLTAAVAAPLDFEQKTQLEEVEFVEEEDRPVWRITLSRPNSQNFEFIRGRPARDYKVLSLDAQTGELLSMKMRSLENVG
ncbi:MAG: hypothetical protein NTV70_00970 [Acidobacteria bacterium]|nr:hypothetical protein [Acidobacteriota bacterium]